MARGTRYGGASLTPDETADPASPQPVKVKRAEIGYVDQPELKEESPSPDQEDGGDSSPSTKKPVSSAGKPSRRPRKAAQTTESPFGRTDKESSDAHSTDGSGTEAQEAESGRVSVRSTDDDDFDEFD